LWKLTYLLEPSWAHKCHCTP